MKKDIFERKRLFLFAAYDAAGIIDNSVILYVRALSDLGDVVFYMDSAASDSELEKIRPYVLFAGASRHKEYDFGSYKRCFVWAKQNLILADYDMLYWANDSMYAPLCPLCPILEKLESKNTDVIGMVYNPSKKSPHIQSWFIGTARTVFMTDWFNAFLSGVKKQNGKGMVIYEYEHGFTRLINKYGASFTTLFARSGRGVYNQIESLYKLGFPFFKKMSIDRKQGGLGRQIYYVLDRIDPELRAAIIENAGRTFGKKYVDKLLTRNIFKIWYRNIKHIIRKILIEGI